MRAKLASIRDVAAAAGVSRSTVSLVLNNSPVPSAATRAKVLRAIHELNYQPDPMFRQAFRDRRAGKANEAPKTRTIGFLTSDIIMEYAQRADQYYSLILSGIQRSVKKARYHLLLHSMSPEENLSLDMLTEKRVDGLLIEGDFSPLLRELATKRLPVTFVDRCYPELPANSVMPNIEEAVREQLRYLWDSGHRNITTFQPVQPDPQITLFERAFRQFFTERGVPPPVYERHEISPETHTAVLREYARKVASCSSRPTALVTWSTYACGLLPEFQALGIRVPSQLSIIGTEDTVEARMTEPQLTTYRFPMDEIGRSAADLLLEQINDPSRAPRHLLINGKLIERASCTATSRS